MEKPLNTQHKKIWRKRISLMDASWRSKFLQSFSILENLHSSRGNEMLDQIYCFFRHPNVLKSISNKFLLKPIIGFFQVNLDGHPPFWAFHGSHWIKNLLSYHNIISSVTRRNKATTSLLTMDLILWAMSLVITL